MHIYFLYNIFLLQIYWGLVEFGNFPEHKFELPFVKGPEPKFLLDKILGSSSCNDVKIQYDIAPINEIGYEYVNIYSNSKL